MGKHIWQCGSFYFKQKRPLVMGVLNVTPDSFSDGGCFSETFDALVHANDMLEQGADIIEVGGESTRPGSSEINPAKELERIQPVVQALVRAGHCVAIDSRHPEVVETCLEIGAAIINDITGFTNPAMLELARVGNAGCVVMHMQGNPQTMQKNPQYLDLTAEVSGFLLEQANLLAAAGVVSERVCLDPGPGFGKSHEQNLVLLQKTAYFANLMPLAAAEQKVLDNDANSPHPYILMAAWSRKRFIGELTGVKQPFQRVAGSVAAALYAANQGAGVLRVHDVGPTVEALKVLEVVS